MRRWCGRTPTTTSNRRCRSTRSRTSSRSGPTNRFTCCSRRWTCSVPVATRSPRRRRQFVLNLLNRPDEMTRLSAILAIESVRIKAASPKLIEIVSDNDRTQVERVAAVKALRVLGDKNAVDSIKALLIGEAPRGCEGGGAAHARGAGHRGGAGRGGTAARAGRPDAARGSRRGAVRDQAGREADRRAVPGQEVAPRLLPAGERRAEQVRGRPGVRQAPRGSAAWRVAAVARTGADREDSRAGEHQGRPEEGPRTVPEHQGAWRARRATSSKGWAARSART